MHFCTCYSGYSTFVWLLDTVVTAHSSQSLCEVLPEDQNALSGLLQMHFGTCYSGYCAFVWHLLPNPFVKSSQRSIFRTAANAFLYLLQWLQHIRLAAGYSSYCTFFPIPL